MEHTSHFQNYVRELYARFSAHDAGLSDRLQRYRNIEPASAQFLSILIRAQQSKCVLEIGTSIGLFHFMVGRSFIKHARSHGDSGN